MVPLSPTLRPAVRSLLRFIHDRNPFFLLSAVCMFIGFRVIIEAVGARPGDWKTLLLLLLTQNIYEAALIGLALFLIVRRNQQRDGWILLGIESLFLVDLPNLNAELFTAAPKLGVMVSAVCFALAITKVGIVLSALKLRLMPLTGLYIAAQFAMMLSLPGIFKMLRSNSGAVSAPQIYAVWCLVGLLFTSGTVLVRRMLQSSAGVMLELPGRLYLLLPALSLLVHLAGENRVYWVHFHAANAGPVLLSLAVLMHRMINWRSMGDALRATLVVLAGAVVVSIFPAEQRAALTAHLGAMTISPLRVILVGSGAIMTHLAWYHVSLIALQFAVSCYLLAGLGASVGEIVHRAYRLLKRCGEFFHSMVPSTPLQWGYVSIGFAFLLLGIGAIFSLKKPNSLQFSDAPSEPQA